MFAIIAQTNGYIASRDIKFNGHTTIIVSAYETLKEANKALLDFYNEDKETYYQNWGLVICNDPHNACSFNDGTRSYEEDSRIYKTDEMEEIEGLSLYEYSGMPIEKYWKIKEEKECHETW